MNDLDELDARQLARRVHGRLTIWHARSAFLSAVAKQPKRQSPAGEVLADQCEKLIAEIARERVHLARDAEAAGSSAHRLVLSTLDELDFLLSKLAESLDGFNLRSVEEVAASLNPDSSEGSHSPQDRRRHFSRTMAWPTRRVATSVKLTVGYQGRQGNDASSQ